MNLTANEITKIAIKELTLRGCKVWRTNQIPVRGRAFIGLPGVPDITGFHKRTGVAVYAEVKAKGDTLSEAQRTFLSEAERAGCHTLIATEISQRFAFIQFRDYLIKQFIAITPFD